MDWLEDLFNKAKADVGKLLNGGVTGQVSFGGAGGTQGSVQIGRPQGLSWPLAFGLLFVVVVVLAFRSK